MGQDAAPTTSDQGSTEARPGSRSMLSREAAFSGWMALEGTIIGYAGFLAIWFQQQEVTAAPAGLGSHCGAVLLASTLAVIALKSGGAYDLTGGRSRDYNRRAILIWL